MEAFQTYFDKIKKYDSTKDTEFTYRPALQSLLEAIAQQEDSNIEVKHEQKRNKEGFGAPDFRMIIRGATLGYVENKKIDETLSKVVRSDQIKKYNELSQNMVVTDYLEWIWLKDLKIVQRARLCDSIDFQTSRFKLDKEKIEKVKELISNFLRATPQPISTPQEFAKALAKPTQKLKEYLLEDLTAQNKKKVSLNTLYKVYEDSLKFLSPEMGLSDFADSVAQTLSYSLFLAKLNSPRGAVLDVYNVKKHIPQSFHLIRALAGFLDELDDNTRYGELCWVLDEILGRINNLDGDAVSQTLTFKEKQSNTMPNDGRWRDPYIYFYEPFLQEYDKGQKIDRGVFYTPPPVVRFIVTSINEILKEEFGIMEGLADKQQVTVLDFACGTGTFLLEVFKQILGGLPATSPKRPGRIKDHILQNIYGFEYIVAPYTIAHLKLSQFLKENGYSLQNNDRLKIYLTNTLEQLTTQEHFFINAIHEEGEKAQEVKQKQILVITGNPPYNNKSKNPSKHKDGKLTYIGNMLKVYKPIDETKLNLDDDYIKFIRFAHQKMEKVDRGVIGIITNNSFLNGLTHRRMRNKLMETFSKIYILNLHGNSLIAETTPDGREDQNVFPIRNVGVAICVFVKNEKQKSPCQVFYRDVWGKQEDKFCFLDANTTKTSNFEPIDVVSFNSQFRATPWGKERFKDELSFFAPSKDMDRLKAYSEGWGIQDIFDNRNSGIQTKNDPTTIQFNKLELQNLIESFATLSNKQLKQQFSIKEGVWTIEKAKKSLALHGYDLKRIINITYRPFDFRWTFFNDKSSGFLARPRTETMFHMLRENIGLVFNRQIVNHSFTHAYLSKFPTIHGTLYLGNKGQDYLAPLYLYKSQEVNNKGQLGLMDALEYDEEGRKENLTLDFRKFIDERYKHHYTPEEILGYVYAILHSSTYRRLYLEFLKIDFPRIPFVKTRNEFDALSKLGQELIDVHLLKSIPQFAVGEPSGLNLEVKQVDYHEEEQRLYINSDTYYADVSKEVWKFEIGGYQVLEQYLKYRKDRTLTSDEVDHIQNIIRVLLFTVTQMQKIEEKWNP